MNVVVIGTGYVGLVQGVGLAELGHRVTCVDTDLAKIAMLQSGTCPIYEPGLGQLLRQNIAANRIHFSSALGSALPEAELAFIAVGTPSDIHGHADLKYVRAVAEQIGQIIQKPLGVVIKSTVPIGTNQVVKDTIERLSQQAIEVISNPEFLREGSAVQDFLHPDRIVIGAEVGSKTAALVVKLYAKLKSPVVMSSPTTAEMIKYASNSFLATQISFINSVANICEQVGANVDQVAEGMKLDKRIGKHAFLSAGLGYGGSCFPKDVRALINMAVDTGARFTLLEQVEAVNQYMRQRFMASVRQRVGNLEGKTIAVWGVAFKPGTDDVREAPAIDIMNDLMLDQVTIRAFDPAAAGTAAMVVPRIHFADTPESACKNADVLIIATEWPQFQDVDWKSIKQTMRGVYVFDGRNVADPSHMRQLGFEYASIGRT